MGAYVLAERTTIGVYDQETFKPTQSWEIESGGKEDVEVLYMRVS
jgi:hypothetical protein